ncbi:MAG: YcxB family protein [Oscillospiraceae bacterium]|nr:YcxB family protein [Oscillospiraceae bacterium]
MKHNGEPLLQKSYHIPLPLFDKAFRSFQKKYVYPRNIVLTIILAAIFAVYARSAFKEPDNTLVYVLLVICLAMILIIWYNPMKLRRSLMQSLKGLENDVYHLTLYEDGVTIGTEDAPDAEEPDSVETVESDIDSDAPVDFEDAEDLPADDDGFRPIFDGEEAKAAKKEPIPETELPFGAGLKIHEFDEFFMLYLVKHNFYVVPKKDFTDAEQTMLRDTLPMD